MDISLINELKGDIRLHQLSCKILLLKDGLSGFFFYLGLVFQLSNATSSADLR